jgi:23S rRNA (guanosine2251-2'-O)-methyltransferase
VGPRRFASPEDILARAAERGEPPFVLALDSLEDPQNVGTLLRSAEAAGVHGVLFPTRRQAPLSPAAIKASAGAVEHLLLCPVDDLASALADMHSHGLRVAGAEADAPLTARQSDLRGPLVIVVGSEGQGLGPTIRRRCDLLMRIPMKGAIGSLNAAVAGSILLFEAIAQRDPEAPARSEPSELALSDLPPDDAADPTPAGIAVEEPAERAAPAKGSTRTSSKGRTPALATTSSQSARTATPVKVAKTPKPAKAAKAAGPAGTVEATPAKVAKTPRPAKAPKPAKATGTTGSVESGKAAKVAKPAATAKAAKPVKPAKTAKVAKPAKRTSKAGASTAESIDETTDLLPGGPSVDAADDHPATTAKSASRKRAPKSRA